MGARPRLPMEQRDLDDGPHRDPPRVPPERRPGVRHRLSLPARCARARRRVGRLADRGALAHHRQLQLFVPRQGAARGLRRLGIRSLLLAPANNQSQLREQPYGRVRQLAVAGARAQGLVAAGLLSGRAARPWYSWLPQHRPSLLRSAIMSTFYKRSLLAVASVVMVHWLPVAGAQDRELGAGGELLEGVAAVVDEGIVLKSELSEAIGRVTQNLSNQQAALPPEQRRPLPPVSDIERQVLDQLIVREIQLQRAERVGITVADDLLNEALSRVASNLGYALEELPTVLAAQGVDYTTYREDSRKDLLVEQLEQRDVVARISITPRELEQCLADSDENASAGFDYNISHILISVAGSATQQDVQAARTRIEEIHSRLEAGEDFARLAVAVSDAQTALDGG